MINRIMNIEYKQLYNIIISMINILICVIVLVFKLYNNTFLGILLLALNLYMLIKYRKNKLLFFAMIIIVYFNFSFVITKYIGTPIELLQGVYNQISNSDTMTIGITALIICFSILNIVIGNMQDIDLNYHLLNNATFEDINWNSSDTNIATVENGKITAISEGNVTITATYEDAEDTIEINVLKPNKLEFVSDIIDVEYRNNSIIEFDIDYYFNDNATEEDIIFESDNPDVVKINNNEFEIVGVGKATITAKYKDVSDTVVVNIYSIDKLEFNKRGYIVKVGDVVKLDYLFDSFDKNEEDIIFTSSDDEVASIVDGNIVAKSQGKVLVTAKYNDIVAQINVIVSDNNYILGDANFDGIVNSDDAAVALDMYRYGNSTSVQKMVADLNFDNIINADDAALILDIYRYGE